MADHIPVLLEEVLENLQLAPGQTIIDGTFGQGGHARAILERIRPGGRLLAIDQDPEAIVLAQKLGREVVAVRGNFSDILTIAQDAFPDLSINGVLLDCGISSTQLADPSLGLSFQTSGPLDMRLSRQGDMSAMTMVNSWPEEQLANTIFSLGEERASRRIAAAIVAARRSEKITTSARLAQIISAAAPRRGRIHPATKTFQALRMAVNRELESLQAGIDGALSILGKGGRLAVISFHSLEDRLVKLAFRAQDKQRFKIITKHTIAPSRQEILTNPRARSAKLRVIEKI